MKRLARMTAIAMMTVAGAACTVGDVRLAAAPAAQAVTAVSDRTATATAVATALASATPAPTSTSIPLPTSTPTPLPSTTPTRAPAPTPIAIPRTAVSVSDAEVVRGNPSLPLVALVFNVGAGSMPAMSILETLREKQYRASFFVMGWWAERQPEVLRSIAAGGHEIASHGHSVFDLTKVSDAEVRADLVAADRVIAAVTGKTTKPLWSPSAGYRDARVRRIAAELGFRPVLWTLDSGDWTYEATARSVTDKVAAGVGNGSIAVMHFDSPTTVESTAKALPGLIDQLRGAGYRLVTITDLLAGG